MNTVVIYKTITKYQNVRMPSTKGLERNCSMKYLGYKRRMVQISFYLTKLGKELTIPKANGR